MWLTSQQTCYIKGRCTGTHHIPQRIDVFSFMSFMSNTLIKAPNLDIRCDETPQSI